jgi:hypothetical protein
VWSAESTRSDGRLSKNDTDTFELVHAAPAGPTAARIKAAALTAAAVRRMIDRISSVLPQPPRRM